MDYVKEHTCSSRFILEQVLRVLLLNYNFILCLRDRLLRINKQNKFIKLNSELTPLNKTTQTIASRQFSNDYVQ